MKKYTVLKDFHTYKEGQKIQLTDYQAKEFGFDKVKYCEACTNNVPCKDCDKKKVEQPVKKVRKKRVRKDNE